MHVATTERLELRWLEPSDDAFLVRLLNEPDWLRFIGDKGVRDLADARRYLAEGPAAQYEKHGFGLNRVALRASGEPIGICGLVVREGLSHPDLGFAFLAAHRGRGHCSEAARAVLDEARGTLRIGRVLAITTPDNHASHRVLERLGFRREEDLRLEADAAPIASWALDL